MCRGQTSLRRGNGLITHNSSSVAIAITLHFTRLPCAEDM